MNQFSFINWKKIVSAFIVGYDVYDNFLFIALVAFPR